MHEILTGKVIVVARLIDSSGFALFVRDRLKLRHCPWCGVEIGEIEVIEDE